MSVTIKATYAALRDWIAPALKTIGNDGMLPVLTWGQIIVRNGHALLVTTDRFSASASRLRGDVIDAPDTETTILATGPDLARVMAVFRPRAGYNPDLGIQIDGHAMTFVGDNDLALTINDPSSENGARFPDVARLIREAVERSDDADIEKVSAFGVNFHRLAALRAAMPARASEATVVATTGGPMKPVLVRWGDDYLGLIMPRRLTGEDEAESPPIITDTWKAALA